MIFETISAVMGMSDGKKRGAAAVATFVLLGGAAAGCGVASEVNDPEANPPEATATSNALAVAAAGAVATPVAPTTTASPGVARLDLGKVDDLPLYPVQYATIDLALEGYMRYGAVAYSDYHYFYLNVANVGQANILDLGVTVHIGPVGSNSGAQYTGFTQNGYVYNPARPDDTIPARSTLPNGPDNHGVIVLFVRKGTFASCSSYQVKLDVNHATQIGPGVYDNDVGVVRTPCDTRYGAAITEQTLGYPPPPELLNNTILNIVSSFQSGRPDHQKCSWCHYKAAPGTFYRPILLNQNDSLLVGPNQVVDNGTTVWKNEGGWATRFVSVGYVQHTPALNDLFRKWIADRWPTD